MAEFTVRKGKTYKARIALTFLESWADNDMIADKVRLVGAGGPGFIDIMVSGSGYYRLCQATWIGPDTTALLPSQITEIIEV